MTANQVWTALDVAKFLKLSRSWVYAAADRNEIPHAKLGSALRFDPDEVKDWFSKQKIKRGVVLPLSERD